MSPKQWMWATVLAAAAAAAAAAAPRAPAAAGAAADTDETPAVRMAGRTVPELAATLSDADASPAVREEAARRLARRTTPEARPAAAQALRAALEAAGDKRGQIAAANGVAETPSPPGPPAELIDPLFGLLGEDRAVAEAAGRALAAYANEPAAAGTVRQRLTQVAANRDAPLPARQAAVRAAGQFVDRAAAQSLADLLSDRRQPHEVRVAAADALAEMTGLREFGRDPGRWRDWLANAARAGQNAEQWRAERLAARNARLVPLQRRHARLVDEIRRLMEGQFQSAETRQDKERVVVQFLDSDEPDVRVAGVAILRRYTTETGQRLRTANRRVADLLADSDPRVRLVAVETLGAIKYEDAMAALEDQAGVEEDPDVLAAIAAALARFTDGRAVPVLLQLLDHPGPRVTVAAAEALRDIGADLRRRDRRMADTVARELLARVRRLARQRGSEELRAAYLDALAPYRLDEARDEARDMLRATVPVAVRRAALRLLGALGDERDAAAIETWLAKEPDPEARKDALDALADTGGAGYVTTFFRRLDNPQAEPDPGVREHTGLAFRRLLPGASEENLVNWAQHFNRDDATSHARRAEVREVLCQKLREAGEPKSLKDLAFQQQSLGGDYMKLADYAKAAKNFREAMDYWLKQEQWETANEVLRSLLDAQLAGKDYEAAARTSEDLLRTRAPELQGPLQGIIGGRLALEAKLLHEDAGDPDAALRLAERALKMEPALDRDHRRNLERRRAEIRRRQPGE